MNTQVEEQNETPNSKFSAPEKRIFSSLKDAQSYAQSLQEKLIEEQILTSDLKLKQDECLFDFETHQFLIEYLLLGHRFEWKENGGVKTLVREDKLAAQFVSKATRTFITTQRNGFKEKVKLSSNFMETVFDFEPMFFLRTILKWFMLLKMVNRH